ncbi:endonuclease III domain-containing protein [Dehalococcoidia bacterium]|nr:endonuclease III domain-containing protein [Dehalococcoidia bacterium]
MKNNRHTDLRRRPLKIYHLLLDAYGPQHWWPADSAFEMIVGAILTQSAAWVNVEKALDNLKAADMLSLKGLQQISEAELAQLIYPSGYFNAKAHKLKAFVDHLAGYEDGLDGLFDQSTSELRRELLGIHGIGEETADSVIVYAAGKPSFVIDSYTRRVVDRLGMRPEKTSYGAYQRLFTDNLPEDATLFNDYHAQLVRHGKDVCRTRQPICSGCPLEEICPTGHGYHAMA